MGIERTSSRSDRFWDSRLDRRQVILTPYPTQPGEVYWKCIIGEWYSREEAKTIGPDHHILVDTLDKFGNRLVGVKAICTNGGVEIKATENKPKDRWAVDFPMFAAGFSYSLSIESKSDLISRMGLGSLDEPFIGHHASFRFVFELTEAQAPTGPEPIGKLKRSEMRRLLKEMQVTIQIIHDSLED